MNGDHKDQVAWLSAAVAAGIGFLQRSLGSTSVELWRDFALRGVSVGSTEWASAFIAAQIGDIPEGRMLNAGVVASLGHKARATGGWGYREDVPEDCDSTAWVLLAAAGTALPAPLVARSVQFMLDHQRDGGGFVTYRPAVREKMGTPDRAGWFEPEVSVTAAAVLALIATGHATSESVRRACAYLSRERHEDCWMSYWWNGFAYGTYHTLLALTRACDPGVETQRAATLRAVLELRRESGGWPGKPGGPDNGFTTSLAILTLLLADETLQHIDLLVGSARWLAGLQTDTGAFLPSTEMLAPGGLKGVDLVVLDHGFMTTACAVKALHEVRERLRSGTAGM